MLIGYDGERGQILVLFTVMFSVILVLSAFAIDQGFWYGRRRIAQRQSDLSARAGAPAFLSSLSNTTGAASAANSAAQANGVSSGSVSASADNNCLGQALPAVHVNVSSHAPGLFTSLGLVSDETAGVDAQARSTACVGSVETLHATAQGGSSFPQGLVLALSRDNGEGSLGVGQPCFNGGDLRLGQECVIYEAGNTNSIAFRAPNDPALCRDQSFRANQIDNELEDGADFTCNASDGACSIHCLALDDDPADTGHVRDVLDGVEDRIGHNATCTTLEEPNAASFQNAFGNADGDPSLAPDPVGLGGTAAPDHVYVQNDCFNNRRIGVMPIVDLDSGSPSHVTGFATVYITGCYHSDQLTNGNGEREDCDAAAGDSDPCDAGGNNGNGNGNGNGNRDCHDCPDECGPDRWQIRAIPIHLFVSTDSLGDIVAPTADAPLTIQTVQ